MYIKDLNKKHHISKNITTYKIPLPFIQKTFDLEPPHNFVQSLYPFQRISLVCVHPFC